MSTHTSAEPRRRGRLLIVAEPNIADEVQAIAPNPADVSPNLYDALGRVTTASSAHDPVTTVVISHLSINSDVNDVAAAFRRVDPSMRLVLIHKNGESAAADTQHFDACVNRPLSAESLLRAIYDGPVDQAAALRAAAERSARCPNETEAVESCVGDTQALAPDIDLPAHTSPASVETLNKSDGIDAQQTHAHDDLNLGDTDLVDAVLQGPGELPDAALRLIRQHTGWNDVRLVSADSALSTNGARVTTGHGEPLFLVSTHAQADQLERWAAWLSRWLKLDAMHHLYRSWAYQDELTGAGNRRFFVEFLTRAIDDAARDRRLITVMVFDIDDFKQYNDRHGHEAGDDILRETVRLLKSVIRAGDKVCRIGGDEFVVIFADPEGPRTAGSTHPAAVEEIAGRFQDQICRMRFPKLSKDAQGQLTISAGLATFPWDGSDATSLLYQADQLALESKRRGKNALTIGRGTAIECRRGKNQDAPPDQA